MILMVPKTSLFNSPPPPKYLFQYIRKHLSYLQNLKYFLQIGLGKLEIVPYVQASKKPRKGPGLQG
jgi:hypothetical protein